MKIRTTIALLSLLFAFFIELNAQSLFINEFMASNVTSTPEIVDYDDYSDWIEIYNDSSGAIDISGYYITDDIKYPTKWRFPNGTWISGKGYLLLWADGYDDSPSNVIKYHHLNFSLSKASEEIGLFSPEEVLVDSVSYSTQISDVSFGRKPDGGSDWFYFGESTPNTSNSTNGTLNTEFSDVPEISLASGIYSGNQIVTINASNGAEIRYTLDGSLPKNSSPQYLSQLDISSTTTLRVRAFENDKLPSLLITKSYFIDEEQNLPILSLTAFPETFFDEKIGFYTNEIKSRELPINVQLFEKNGDFAFEVDAGVRLTGQASFQYPQKPLTIEVDDRFGYETIDYPIFSNRPINQYTTMYLRNSGTQDNRHTMFRDALQHTIVINQMDLDCQAYRPVATYINGEYWGIYNIREKLDNNYLVAHHNVNPNNIDYLEYDFQSEPVVIEGSTDEYYALQNYLASHSMNIEANWEYVKTQIDVNEVMNYLITEIYCDNVNWPYTNSRWWKEKSDQGKWRYIFLDSDYGFGAPSWMSHYTNNTLDFLYYYMGYPFSSFIFKKLLENNEFKNEFIQRFATYLNTIFKSERVVGIVDSLKSQINTEMFSHIDRWKDDTSIIYGYPAIPDMKTWNLEVSILREFADKRPQYMKQSILDFYNLSGVENISFKLSNPNNGSISLTGVKVEDGFTGEYFRYVPIKIEATPSVGYRFVKWIGVPDSLSSATFYTPSRSDSTIQITAVFEEDNSSLIPSNITANTTLSISGSPYIAAGDIIVNSNITLTMEPGVVILMPEKGSLIVNGILKINGTDDEPIIIRPNENSGFSKWGVIYLENATGECTINNVQLIGATKGSLLPNQVGAISSYKSDVIIENTIILDAPFPIFIQYGNAIVRNCNLHSDETSDFINIKYAETALIENCEFRGNNSFDTDAIDLDQISNGTVRGNKIYNFSGFNSDGIDLGEGSKDILIEDNLIFNINDKGISVGQASTTNIKKNIIVNCAQGVGIKDDSSYAFIDRNTFFGCDYGVASFEKNIGAGGGNAEIINSIFSKSVISSVFVDNLSALSVNYSLSDIENLDGEGNIETNPIFLNNFLLSPLSPAIDIGNPLTELDADGTQADLGANYFHGKKEQLIINEIHYNPDNGDNYEFIELYYSGDEVLDASGYKLSGEIDFTFPINLFLNPNSFIVIAKDKTLYESLDAQVFNWDGDNLPNTWGNIQLQNEFGDEIDFVSYSSKYNWPLDANGAGKSLELRNPNDENLVTANWKASNLVNGSPGNANKIDVNNLLFINEFQADNKNTVKDEFGEYDDWIEIYNSSNNPIDISGLYITDDYSNLTKHQITTSNNPQNIIPPNGYLLLWADGNSDQGLNHLNFKLKASGEEIAISYVFENDTTIVDSVKFSEQENDFSYARENDGDNNWGVVRAPTPNKRNSFPGLFNNDVLLVNGFRFRITEVVESYENKVFWGDYVINFWDLLAETTNGYPSTLPEPMGHGAVPLDTLINYSTVIWTGENNLLEINFWRNSDALEYVKMGGNLILLLKNGRDYINDEMYERLGITWAEPELAVIANCIPIYGELDTIAIKNVQVLCSIFDTTLTNNHSKILFTETATYSEPVGIGVWNKPEFGGWYKENGGQIIFLAGRAYRYDNDELKSNIEYILENFLNETTVSVDGGENNLQIIEYKLNQNFPNPFNPTTVIRYELVNDSKVDLKIYNILGQEVKTLVSKFEKKGRKAAVWDGTDNFNSKVSSGIYFYRVSANQWSDIKKMILLK